MTKAIGNLGLFSKNIAAQLDSADGKKDNQISALVWNGFVKDKGGKELKYSPYISLENAEKSISQYIYNLHLSSHKSVDDISNEWANALKKEEEAKKAANKPKTVDYKNVPAFDGTKPEDMTMTKINNPKTFESAGIKYAIKRVNKNTGAVVDYIYYYNDGKVVKEYKDPSEKTRGKMHDLLQHGTSYKSVIPKKGVVESARPITIGLPSDASANAKSMAKSLEKNKAKLMSMLKIDNKTYNEYARLTLAIADRETDFGAGYCRDGVVKLGVTVPGSKTIKYSEQYRIVKESESETNLSYLDPDQRVSIKAAKKEREDRANTSQPSIQGRAKQENDALSCGFTQIKFDNIVNSAKNSKDRFHNINKNILDNFNAVGITKASDLYNPEKCAMATLIWMSYVPDKLEIEMKEEHSQRKNKAAQPYYNLDAHLEASNGYIVKNDNGEITNIVKNITLSDVIACRWNTSGAGIQDGTFNPKGLPYISNSSIGINHCLEKYKVTQK